MLIRAAAIAVVLLYLVGCGEPVQLAPDAVLPDGGVYQGEFKNGLFHGQGSLKYPSGAYYRGEFENGSFHGQGLFVNSQGIEYQGEFANGAFSGEFVITNVSDDIKYEGGLKNGDMHGMGTLSSPAYVYVGEFKFDEFDGLGKITHKNGEVYEGEFMKSLYHGQGVFWGDDQSRYEGEFRNNYFDGQGKVEYNNGAVYLGQFKAGNYHGQGRYSHQETWYEGHFVDGVLNGKAEIFDAQGDHYIGEVENWRPHGQGELRYADGSISKGKFEYGVLEGEGELSRPDGSHYKGEFEYNEYSGSGELRSANGSIYKGEFAYGRYHGHGSLETMDENGTLQMLEGRWKNGKLAYNFNTGERLHEQAESALENHQRLLTGSLSAIEASDDQANVFFLGVAGDGSQSVFRRELEFVAEQIDKKYHSKKRSVLLINHHDTAEKYPMASRRSIASSLEGIAMKMNTQEDVLLMYLTSHGSKNHDFYLNHDSIRLPDISPSELKDMLDQTKIKWRVIMVSACYSGGFIPQLSDSNTLVMTAADAQSQSFGCSEDSEMTYFGKALFKEVLSNNHRLELMEAFEKAKDIILGWEKEQELDASMPQISAPNAIVKKMAELEIINQRGSEK